MVARESVKIEVETPLVRPNTASHINSARLLESKSSTNGS